MLSIFPLTSGQSVKSSPFTKSIFSYLQESSCVVAPFQSSGSKKFSCQEQLVFSLFVVFSNSDVRQPCALVYHKVLPHVFVEICSSSSEVSALARGGFCSFSTCYFTGFEATYHPEFFLAVNLLDSLCSVVWSYSV